MIKKKKLMASPESIKIPPCGSDAAGPPVVSMGATPHTHTHTHNHPPHHHQHPPHPTRLLHGQSPLSLRNRATLSLPLSVKPTAPAPSRYLRGDNHGNSSTVGTGHQLTKIDGRKMEGKKERKEGLPASKEARGYVCGKEVHEVIWADRYPGAPSSHSSQQQRDTGRPERPR